MGSFSSDVGDSTCLILEVSWLMMEWTVLLSLFKKNFDTIYLVYFNALQILDDHIDHIILICNAVQYCEQMAALRPCLLLVFRLSCVTKVDSEVKKSANAHIYLPDHSCMVKETRASQIILELIVKLFIYTIKIHRKHILCNQVAVLIYFLMVWNQSYILTSQHAIFAA